MKHKPKDLSSEKFEQMWDNQTYVMQPIYDYLRDIIRAAEVVKESDFEIPNHHALWALREGKKSMAAEIQALLPKDADSRELFSSIRL